MDAGKAMIWIRRSVSEQEILAKQSPNGGWSRADLAAWGISWPPPRGWKRALISGRWIDRRAQKEES